MPLQQFSIWFIFPLMLLFQRQKRFDKFYVPYYYYWEFLPEFLFYVLKSCFFLFFWNVFTLCPYYISKVKYFPIKAKKGENCKEESFNSFILQLFRLSIPTLVYQTQKNKKKKFKRIFQKTFSLENFFDIIKFYVRKQFLKVIL